MQVYNPSSDNKLTENLHQLLLKYRFQKNFNVPMYLHAKSTLLNNYMKKFSLKSCVVAVSGGIDSACVLAIVNYAKQQPHSPIEKIVPLLLPVFNNIGATGQDTATKRGKDVCLSQHLEPIVIPLEVPHQTLKTHVENQLNYQGKAWAEGQLVAHMRTPSLYYTATLLAQENLPGIICGTTNRDEGLYLGYFGKASDGLVDMQIISDLHKSEVYQVAKYLNIPEETLCVDPTGDMYDGRLDEEVFGAPYDFVELYMYYLSLENKDKELIHHHLDNASKEQFNFFQTNLDNMHQYNRHKYFGASPAVHLDLDIIDIKEGWKTNCTFNRPIEKPIDITKFVNHKTLPFLPSFFYQERQISIKSHKIQNSILYEINDLLSTEECNWIKNKLNMDKDWLNVDEYGKKDDLNSNKEKIGSLRKSSYSLEISELIYKRLLGYLPHIFYFDTLTQMSNNKNIWSLAGVNPLLRFIKYEPNQFLVPHYDDTYEYHSYKKTLQSLIIYLDDNIGQTRFLQDHFPLNEKNKNYSDWDFIADDNLVLQSFTAKIGNALIFPHRLLHDAPPVQNSDFSKTILRTDIIYESPYLGFEL